MDKISLLVPIIYINMSPLHSAPFDKILYGLSQYYFTQWFEKKHRKIDKAVWTRKSVNGKAQCQACHQGADIGDFEDDGVRIPL
jgi:cytochrome c peroxidase